MKTPIVPALRAVNITKARLEGLFVDELERFQPPGYMRLLKESVLRVWHERKASGKNEVVLRVLTADSGIE